MLIKVNIYNFSPKKVTKVNNTFVELDELFPKIWVGEPKTARRALKDVLYTFFETFQIYDQLFRASIYGTCIVYMTFIC